MKYGDSEVEELGQALAKTLARESALRASVAEAERVRAMDVAALSWQLDSANARVADAAKALDAAFQRVGTVASGDYTKPEMIAPDIAYLARLLKEANARVAELEQLYRDCLDCLQESAKGDGKLFTQNRALKARIRTLEAECVAWRVEYHEACSEDCSGAGWSRWQDAGVERDAARAATGPIGGVA